MKFCVSVALSGRLWDPTAARRNPATATQPGCSGSASGRKHPKFVRLVSLFQQLQNTPATPARRCRKQSPTRTKYSAFRSSNRCGRRRVPIRLLQCRRIDSWRPTPTCRRNTLRLAERTRLPSIMCVRNEQDVRFATREFVTPRGTVLAWFPFVLLTSG